MSPESKAERQDGELDPETEDGEWFTVYWIGEGEVRVRIVDCSPVDDDGDESGPCPF